MVPVNLVNMRNVSSSIRGAVRVTCCTPVDGHVLYAAVVLRKLGSIVDCVTIAARDALFAQMLSHRLPAVQNLCACVADFRRTPSLVWKGQRHQTVLSERLV